MNARFNLGVFGIAVGLGFSFGCKKSDDATAVVPPAQPAVGQFPVPGSAPTPPAPAPVVPSPPPFGSAATADGISGTLIAAPSPVLLCDKTGLGVATLVWTMSGTNIIEIRVGAPDGLLFTRMGAPGTLKTGNWVREGSKFYLQNRSKDAPLTLDNTLAVLEVATAPGGPCK